MSMESATTALAESSEQRPLKSIFGGIAPQPALNPQETPVVEGNPYDTAALNPPRERDKTERFARDINAKIDTLEVQMGRSTHVLEQAQECVKQALAQQQADIDQQRQQLDAQQAEVDRQRKTLEIHGHNLSAHSTAIATQGSQLDHHQSYLAAHAEQINSVDDRQQDMQQMLLGLSQEQEHNTAKVDMLAEQVYDVSKQASAERNNTHQRFRLLTGALIGTTLFTLGVFSYFLYNPIAAPKSVEAQLATINAELIQQKDSTSLMSGDVQRIGASLTLLEGTLSELQSAHMALQSNQQAGRDDVAKLQGQITSVQKTIGDLKARMQRSSSSAAPAAASKPVVKVSMRDNRWLASRPGDHYVIQLLGTRDFSGLQRFANNNASALKRYPLAYARGTGANKEWYNLVYGDFASKQQANNAMASLPAALRNNQPWIRQVRSLR